MSKILDHIASLFRSTDETDKQTRIRVDAVRAVTGAPVGDLALYTQAMKHRSRLRGRPGSQIESNERLEYLGDALLGMIVAEHLYRSYPAEAEGFLTRMRSKLVNGRALAMHARRIGVGDLLLLSENMAAGDGRANANILADAYEALIGAIYLDQGHQAAEAFVTRTALDSVDLAALARREDNPKSLLLEYAQARGWPQPKYRVTQSEGPSHDRTFSVEAVVRDQPSGTGQAGSKKTAEQLAAADALERFRQQDADDPEGS